MKKLIIAALLVVGITAFAQDRKEMGNRPDRKPEMEKLSPEQRTQLMVKKMTLELDLNAKQQEQVKQIIAEKTAKWEAMKAEHRANKEDKKRPTADEQFTRRNKMLDEQIAMQNNMKNILSPEQFERWRNLKEKFEGKFQERRQGRDHENGHERDHKNAPEREHDNK
jgi:hypothetical protein